MFKIDLSDDQFKRIKESKDNEIMTLTLSKEQVKEFLKQDAFNRYSECKAEYLKESLKNDADNTKLSQIKTKLTNLKNEVSTYKAKKAKKSKTGFFKTI